MEQTNNQAPTTTENSKRWYLKIGTGLVVVAAFISAVVFSRKDASNTEVADNTTNTSSTEGTEQSPSSPKTNNNPVNSDNQNSSPANTTKSAYKDGTYTATGSYVAPTGKETFDLSITIKNGIVTSSIFTPQSENNVSAKFQKEFAESHKEYVIGKNISDIKLDKIAGSSLTPVGFNEALATIKTEAGA